MYLLLEKQRELVHHLENNKAENETPLLLNRVLGTAASAARSYYATRHLQQLFI